MGLTHKLSGALVGVTLVSTLVPSARASWILSDLVTNQSAVVIGDKTFSEFSYFGTGANPLASAITVDPLNSGGLLGLRFTGDFHDNNTDDVPSDAVIKYTVTVNDPTMAISTVYIDGPVNTGDHQGYIQVNETFDGDNGVAIQLHSDGSQTLFDFATLNVPQTTLHVSKDIMLWANPNPDGLAAVAYVDQTFGQVPIVNVPEPASLGLLAVGALALMNRRR